MNLTRWRRDDTADEAVWDRYLLRVWIPSLLLGFVVIVGAGFAAHPLSTVLLWAGFLLIAGATVLAIRQWYRTHPQRRG